jgi:enoyl-[acyl-carrier protein] reductase I
MERSVGRDADGSRCRPTPRLAQRAIAVRPRTLPRAGTESRRNRDVSLTNADLAALKLDAIEFEWSNEMDARSENLLSGRKGLIVGMANEQSIAYGCARMFRQCGAELAITWLNDKTRSYVEPLARELSAAITIPLDVEQSGAMEAVFDTIGLHWGRLDFLLHSIAFAPAPDLHGRVADVSREGFARAMDISCHSFMRMARLAEPLMDKGGTMLTMSYLGAEEVVPRYGVMGPVKAALEATVRYLATELGPRGIRVNAVSPGPMKTRSASGIRDFDALFDEARRRAPLTRQVEIDDVGSLCAFLVSDAAQAITGDTHYIDGGLHILA